MEFVFATIATMLERDSVMLTMKVPLFPQLAMWLVQGSHPGAGQGWRQGRFIAGGDWLAQSQCHVAKSRALGRDRWQLWVQKDVLRNVNICEDAEWGASLTATFKGLCEKNSHAKNHHAITLILLVPHTSLKVRRVSWNVRICDN